MPERTWTRPDPEPGNPISLVTNPLILGTLTANHPWEDFIRKNGIPQINLWIGHPGMGKSFQQEANLKTIKEIDPNFNPVSITIEKTFRYAQIRGYIDPSHKSGTWDEIDYGIAGVLISGQVFLAIQRGFHPIIDVECPATAAKIDGIWHGEDRGKTVVEALAGQEDEFKDLGYGLRIMINVADARRMISSYSMRSTLEEFQGYPAEKVRLQLAKKGIFLSEKTYQEMQKGKKNVIPGATGSGQIIADARIRPVLHTLITQGLIENPISPLFPYKREYLNIPAYFADALENLAVYEARRYQSMGVMSFIVKMPKSDSEIDYSLLDETDFLKSLTPMEHAYLKRRVLVYLNEERTLPGAGT